MFRRRIKTSSNASIIALADYQWTNAQSINYPNAVNPTVNLSVPYRPTSGAFLWTLPNGYPTRREVFEDNTGRDGRFRDCLHTLEVNEFNAPILGPYAFTNTGMGNTYAMSLNKTEHMDPLVTLDTLGPSVNMTVMADEALAFMMPTLNEGTSLVNFILELKDLKKSLGKARTAVARIRGGYIGNDGKFTKTRPSGSTEIPYSDLTFGLKGGKKKIVKDVIRRLTGAHLEAVYGAPQSVKDVIEATTQLMELEHKLEVLKRYANKPQVRHYRRILPQSPGVPAVREWKTTWRDDNRLWPSSSGVQGYSCHPPDRKRYLSYYRRRRWIQRPVYTATMRYSYTLPSMGPVEEKIAAYMDVLGLRLDPGIIWDALPFTFIIDWVANVGDFLHSFAQDNYPINVTVMDFCHSMAYHAEGEVHVSFQDDSSNDMVADGVSALQWHQPGAMRLTFDQCCIRRVYKYYNRTRIVPNTRSIATKRLKLRQAAIAGSLILNKTLSKRSRK